MNNLTSLFILILFLFQQVFGEQNSRLKEFGKSLEEKNIRLLPKTLVNEQSLAKDMSEEPCLFWSYQTVLLRRTTVSGSVVPYPPFPDMFVIPGAKGRLAYFDVEGNLKSTYSSPVVGVSSDPKYSHLDGTLYFRVGVDSFERVRYNTIKPIWVTTLGHPVLSREVQDFYVSIPSTPEVTSISEFPYVFVGGVDRVFTFLQDKNSPVLLWSFNVSTCTPNIPEYQGSEKSAWVSTPVYSEEHNAIFFTTSCGEVYSVDVNGGLIWRMKVDGDKVSESTINSRQEENITETFDVLSPLSYSGGSLYFGQLLSGYQTNSTGGYYVFSLDAETGSLKWSQESSGSVNNQPLVLSTSIIFGEGNVVSLRNLTTGEIIWSNQLEFDIFASPYSPDPKAESPFIYVATLGSIYYYTFDGVCQWILPGSMVGTPLVLPLTTSSKRQTVQSLLVITDEYSPFGFAEDCNGGCEYEATYKSETTEIVSCSGHGDCSYGSCRCLYGYKGENCESCDNGFVETETGCRVDSDDDSDDSSAYTGLIVVVSIVFFFAFLVVIWWFYRSRYERDGWEREEQL